MSVCRRRSAAHNTASGLPGLFFVGKFPAMLNRFIPALAALMIAPMAQANTGPAPVTQAAFAVAAPTMPLVSRDAMSGTPESLLAVSASPRPLARRMSIPKARWGTTGGRSTWSLAVLSSLRGHANALPDVVPADIDTWCPAYESGSREQREAFWLGLVSALVKHESTFKPTAVGGGGKWIGLMQILPSTARLYGCQATTVDGLKDPRANLSCGLRIMARTVARDGVVSANMRGVAADWGPFHSRKKREDMIAWTRAQGYCTGMGRSLRPVGRPASLLPGIMASNELGAGTRPLARSRALDASYANTFISTKGQLLESDG